MAVVLAQISKNRCVTAAIPTAAGISDHRATAIGDEAATDDSLTADPLDKDLWDALDFRQNYTLGEYKSIKLDRIDFDSFETGLRQTQSRESDNSNEGFRVSFLLKPLTASFNRQLQRIDQEVAIDYGDHVMHHHLSIFFGLIAGLKRIRMLIIKPLYEKRSIILVSSIKKYGIEF